MQTQRANHPAESVFQYFIRSRIIPLYDHMINQLECRFSALSNKAVLALKLLPEKVSSASEEEITSVEQAHSGSMPYPESFRNEVKLYKQKCRTDRTPPPTCSHVLGVVPYTLFPNLHSLFKTQFTYPVTSADVE